MEFVGWLVGQLAVRDCFAQYVSSYHIYILHKRHIDRSCSRTLCWRQYFVLQTGKGGTGYWTIFHNGELQNLYSSPCH